VPTKQSTQNPPERYSVEWSINQVNLASAAKVTEFLMAGAFPLELGIDWQPPLVENLDGWTVVHERMRIL
jgi:hypothetical protein